MEQVAEEYSLGTEANAILEQYGTEVAESVDTIVGEFIAREVQSRQPNFAKFARAVQRFPPMDRHGTWYYIAFEYKSKGESKLALQCFLQALIQNPIRHSLSWRWIKEGIVLADDDPLYKPLSELGGSCFGAAEANIDRVILELRNRIGEPVGVNSMANR